MQLDVWPVLGQPQVGQGYQKACRPPSRNLAFLGRGSSWQLLDSTLEGVEVEVEVEVVVVED